MTNTAQNFRIDDRLAFIQLDDERCARIRSIKAILDKQLPIALDKFYRIIQNTPETKKFFSSTTHMDSAKNAQVAHWRSISSGNFDDAYVSNVRKVGQTHARIGLEPRWYIGGYALVVDHLIHAIVTEMWPKNSTLFRQKVGPDDVAGCLGALIKAMMMDMDLSISMYVEAAEEARLKLENAAKAEADRIRAEEAVREAKRKSEEDAANRERASVLSSMGAAIAKLAEKNLTSRIREALPEAYKSLQQEFNAAVEQFETALQQVVGVAGAMVSGTQEIASAADDLSKRTEQQAASLEETAAALEEITNTVKKTASESALARDTVTSAKSAAETSRDVVRQAVDAMAEIETSSKEISKIIGVIDEIAFQTNLLALNAGVEAARAGDAGRGFAVVASEVRALAQRSAEAAKQIKSLISRSSEQVAHGVRFVSDSGKTLEQIISHVMSINGMVLSIAHAAEEQATGLAQVNVAINDLDQTTQQNAAMVEQTTAACHTLSQQTGELSDLISGFTLSQQGAASLRRSAEQMSKKITPRLLRDGKSPQPQVKQTSSAAEKTDWEEF
jgi:methyl-accepting chemotaxis protein